jgi:hypothetical protein
MTTDQDLQQGIAKIDRLIECDLYIKRVPKPALQWFKEYSQAEFSGDYGALLRELIYAYRGMFHETRLAMLEEVHANTVELLKRTEPVQVEQKPSVIKMADGSVRRR